MVWTVPSIKGQISRNFLWGPNVSIDNLESNKCLLIKKTVRNESASTKSKQSFWSGNMQLDIVTQSICWIKSDHQPSWIVFQVNLSVFFWMLRTIFICLRQNNINWIWYKIQSWQVFIFISLLFSNVPTSHDILWKNTSFQANACNPFRKNSSLNSVLYLVCPSLITFRLGADEGNHMFWFLNILYLLSLRMCGVRIIRDNITSLLVSSWIWPTCGEKQQTE